MVRRSSPELARSRFRVSFFCLLALSSLGLGSRPAMGVALAAAIIGVLSMRVAIAQGRSLAFSFVVVDWLALGVAMTLTGGLRTWLAALIPLLTAVELMPAQRHDRRSLAPAAGASLAVLLIADPSLGGGRPLGLFLFAALVTAGVLLTAALHLPSRRRPQKRPAAVDATTGFYSLARVGDLVGDALDEAAARHEPLSVVCVQLDRFVDLRDFHGSRGGDAIVAAVARRLSRRLKSGDLAFRVSPDTFVLALPERKLAEARTLAAGMRHEVAVELINEHRLTVSAGVASYPVVRDLGTLLREAYADLQRQRGELRPAASQ